jgi:hypothetical protein
LTRAVVAGGGFVGVLRGTIRIDRWITMLVATINIITGEHFVPAIAGKVDSDMLARLPGEEPVG